MTIAGGEEIKSPVIISNNLHSSSSQKLTWSLVAKSETMSNFCLKSCGLQSKHICVSIDWGALKAASSPGCLCILFHPKHDQILYGAKTSGKSLYAPKDPARATKRATAQDTVQAQTLGKNSKDIHKVQIKSRNKHKDIHKTQITKQIQITSTKHKQAQSTNIHKQKERTLCTNTPHRSQSQNINKQEHQ